MDTQAAIGMLDVFECDDGRKIVHSFTLSGMGADWDLEAVEKFISESDVRGEAPPSHVRMRHALMVKSGVRYIAFATKDPGPIEGRPIPDDVADAVREIQEMARKRHADANEGGS